MSIKSYENGWIARFKVGGREFEKRFPTKREAVEYEEVTKGDFRRNRINLPNKVQTRTFQEACDYFYTNYCIPNEQFETKYHFPYLVEFFGADTPISKITKEKVKELYAKMMTDFAPSTVIRKFSTLISLFRENVSHCPVNPAKGIIPKQTRKRAHKPRQKWLTNEEMKKLYDILLNPPPTGKNPGKPLSKEELEENMLFALIDRNTGFRSDNMEDMEWGRDTDFKNNLVWARDTKAGHDYSVPMTPSCRSALQRLWEMKGKPARGKVFRHTNWSHIFTKAFRQLGLNDPKWPKQENAVLHTLRHTFCSYLVMGGYNERTVADLMGWKGTSEFSTYAHLAPSYKQSAINTIDFGYKSEGDKLLEEVKNEGD